MEKLLIETREFTARISAFLSDENYSELQALLRANPDIGKVMPGCGGMRKIRVADPRRGKGKRRGIRVVYLHVSEPDTVYFADIYDKCEKDDLHPSEKKRLRQLAAVFKKSSE